MSEQEARKQAVKKLAVILRDIEWLSSENKAESLYDAGYRLIEPEKVKDILAWFRFNKPYAELTEKEAEKGDNVLSQLGFEEKK